MKQSLIITIVLCVLLGNAFCFITQKEQKQQQTAPTTCCIKQKEAEIKAKQGNRGTAEVYAPLVPVLGYN